MACCGCFRKLKPRYKRHVEDIFPSSPDEGIVSSQMEKLTYYSLSAPEKLDRIGAYLAKRVKHDLARRRYGYESNRVQESMCDGVTALRDTGPCTPKFTAVSLLSIATFTLPCKRSTSFFRSATRAR